MNPNDTTRTSPFNIIAVATALVALAAIVASARSSADVATVATTAAAQATKSDAMEAPLPSETPASMSYHDSINVAAIAVAAYDR